MDIALARSAYMGMLLTMRSFAVLSNPKFLPLPLGPSQPEELTQAVDTPTIVDEVTLTMSVTDGNLVASIDKLGVVGTIIPVPIHVGKVSRRRQTVACSM